MTDNEIYQRIINASGDILETLKDDNWLARVDLNPSRVARMLEVAYRGGRFEQADSAQRTIYNEMNSQVALLSSLLRFLEEEST
jgi:hypothetical protein